MEKEEEVTKERKKGKWEGWQENQRKLVQGDSGERTRVESSVRQGWTSAITAMRRECDSVQRTVEVKPSARGPGHRT